MSQMITKYLGSADLQKYENHIIPYGPIGSIVDTRTYLRWVPKLNRRETPLERWQRVINYNLSLVSDKHTYNELRDESLWMLDMFANMKADVSGRTKWVGGSESSLSSPEGNFNCFSRETEFLTKQGYKTFLDFEDGDTVEVLSSFKTGRSGVWTEATVHKYTEKPLYKLTLCKGTSTQDFYTTSDHRWIFKTQATNDLQETITSDLKIGSIIPTLAKPSNVITACSHGIQHGLVFGDGTFVKRTGNCRIDLIGGKQEFVELFSTGYVINKGSKGGEINDNITTITGLPYNWKTLPSIKDVNQEYLKGFIMGWFAADGNASGNVTISSANLDNLEWLRSALAVLGQYTGKPRLLRALSPFDGSDKPCYSLSLYIDDLTEDFFLNSSHKLNFSPSVQPKEWRVKSLEMTDRVEEVWCVSEPKTESFTLSGGIKTKNCSFTIINRLSVFSEIFGLLMNGCGVGFRVFNSDICNLPRFDRSIELEFEAYNPIHKEAREEHTRTVSTVNNVYVEVGDSRKGWMNALDIYLKLVTDPSFIQTKIVFNLDSIRPIGERIKGFGGTASGPDAFKGIIEDIHQIIQESNQVLTSIDCMDVVCAIAKGVVAGSSRRSALISLFEQGDTMMSNAKVGLYSNPDLIKKSYRSQSNNTVCLMTKPSLEEIQNLLHTCKTEGEPGFNNFPKMVQKRINAATIYRPENPTEWYTNVGTNPCHEIILSGGKNGDSVSFCNLTTLPLPNFVQSSVNGNSFDMDEFEQAIRLNTRISMRQTCVEFGNEQWSETQSDERLLGVSLTGCQDMFSMMGWKTSGKEIEQFLISANVFANDEADKYSHKLGIPRPLLVTTLKPEGTSSKIFGTSSGLHWDWAPFYINRVRMTCKDALAQTLLKQGFTAIPEIYDLLKIFGSLTLEDFKVYPKVHKLFKKLGSKKLTGWDCLDLFEAHPTDAKLALLNTCNTIVFAFPCKSNSTVTQSDVSAIEQLESVKTFTKFYTDHMPSSTISVKEHEWDDVANWIDKNWDDYITASFFPYYGGSYPLLPLEAITEDVYKQMLTEIPEHCKNVLDSGRVAFVVNENLLSEIEREMGKTTDDELGSDCQTGVCPIR